MTEKFTVCIIDDDDDFRKSLAWLLERHKFNVQQYSAASSFLDQAPPAPVTRFATREDAEGAGNIPCGLCRPDLHPIAQRTHP